MTSVTALALIAAVTSPALAQEAPAPAEPYPIIFPVAGDHSYSNSWGAPRSGGRTHRGTDIFAAKGTPVVAAADGRVVRMALGTNAGRFIVLEHAGGWQTFYLHLNNDTDGTDDGLHSEWVEGISVGAEVTAGDLLDYVGDSGNAEETPPHLHFEIHDAAGNATNPYPHLRAAEGRPVPADPVTPAATPVAAARPVFAGQNVSYVGRLDPGTGFASDIEVQGGTAYLGTWGRPEACPATGVRVIDVSDPTAPVSLGTIASGAAFPGTSTDSLWVGPVETAAFSGDLAVVALRLCDTAERSRRNQAVRGLALYDVTNPAAPTLVGTFDSGAATQGIHEVDVVTRADGTLLAAATAMQSVRHTGGAIGDLRIIDITDPAAPIQLTDWDLRRDGPREAVGGMLTEVYDDLELHAHSAVWSPDGTALWIANWDAGVVMLDTTDPARPRLATIFGYDPETEGNAHSVAIDFDAGLLIRNDQDLINADVERHGAGWGGQRLYDITNPVAAVEIGAFWTDRSKPNETGRSDHVDGRYSAHDAVIVAGIEYAAWYSDGVRIVDVTDPAAPEEIGWFIPPARVDPQGYWDAPNGDEAFAMVWGVAVAGDGLIYVSDMNSGLWIMRSGSPTVAMDAVATVEFPGL